jgi:hypothetical protein
MPGTTLSTQNTPSSHADFGINAKHDRERYAAAATASTSPRPDST